ncbi:MAG: sugar-binding protein [Caldilineaceae bacterium]
MTPTPSLTPTAEVAQAQRQRPDANRIFTAVNAGHALDANFDDWGDGWNAISAVVEGSGNYTGVDDANGEFQVSWSLEGLYLAVRVRDNRYRPGPDGSDMWQGDTLELHFDRNLAADFDRSLADDDDYQLGLAWGPARDEVRLYRWLPLAKEGAYSISGAVAGEEEGYRAEVLIPWTLLDVTGDQLHGDQRFGFNLSISDNDADAPAQESILSASPSRTTYNNPMEWGTLVLQ